MILIGGWMGYDPAISHRGLEDGGGEKRFTNSWGAVRMMAHRGCWANQVAVSRAVMRD